MRLRGLGRPSRQGCRGGDAGHTALWLDHAHCLPLEIRSEFDQIDTSNPNCVVMADAGDGFTYENMNQAFRVLMELERPVLISLGKG